MFEVKRYDKAGDDNSNLQQVITQSEYFNLFWDTLVRLEINICKEYKKCLQILSCLKKSEVPQPFKTYGNTEERERETLYKLNIEFELLKICR